MYLELKRRQEREMNGLPIKWAFSKEQFKKAMAELGLKETEGNKIHMIGSGGFMLWEDAPDFRDMMNRHRAEREAALQDDQYVYEGFLYELANHEYCITYEYEYALGAMGLTEKQVSLDARLLKLLKQATDEYLKGVEF